MACCASQKGAGGLLWPCCHAIKAGESARTFCTRLAAATDQDVYAEILADNTPSIKACLNAGYHIAYAMDKHAVLVHTK